ncbi:hypothetical protein EWM64_g1677 [Hericium alpestre]|uniref:Uncharacterized protein n=1 Tax=Hericium alpestre TaxID=135208 RepID=A0A4Z0A5P3_9AGAM|nr:hypothetical protein EWM64_g1677 [Hericium alpestre]
MPSSYPRRQNRVSLDPGALPSSQLAPDEDRDAQLLQFQADDAAIMEADNKKSQEDGDYVPSQQSGESSQSTDAYEDEDMPYSQPNGAYGSEAGSDETSTGATSSQEAINLHKRRLTQIREAMMLDECTTPSHTALIIEVLAIAWDMDEGIVFLMAKEAAGRTEE